MLGIIGLLLAIVVMIYGAYKGLAALPLTILASLVIILTNGMPIWESYSQYYVGGYAGAYASYFLIFIFSALYAKLMDTVGCTTAIGYKLIDWFGKKHVAVVVMLINAVLTYGGVSLFVCIFAVGPIAYLLFKEADLPRKVIVASLLLGGAGFTLSAMPASPQMTNVIASKYLGTPLTSAPVLGLVCAAAMLALSVFYLIYEEKAARASGQGFSFPAHVDPNAYTVVDRAALPAAWKAFLPLIVLIGFIIVGSRFISDATLLTVAAMLIGSVLVLALNFDRFKGKSLKALMGQGMAEGLSAIGGIAAVIGFGTVLQHSAGFGSAVAWILGLDLPIYLKATVSTAAISAIVGSSSGGLNLTLQTLSDAFLASGANMETLHRLVCMASATIDTLPHAGGMFLVFGYLGLTHKEAYKYVFKGKVMIAIIVTVLATAACILLGL